MPPQQQPLQPYVPPAGSPPPAGPMPAQPAYQQSNTPNPYQQPQIDLDQPPPGFAPISQTAPPMPPQQPAPPMPGPAMPSLDSPQLAPQPPMAQTPVSPDIAPGSADPRQEVINRLRQANNVLVTVSSSPSVDQLAAAIAVTLLLNKLDKHATAVFSGNVPSTLEFLQPEKTIEKNTDSLRDFIIALDKAKADKLRYKVEDKFVKIFITPYHTSLSQDDLEFSQGDFNVDVVIAIGVQKRDELDQAITAHGRILHDAAVVSVNNEQTAELGSINWFDPGASSLCEMLVGIIEPLQGKQALLDEQIATAFLTGVVAETERFSNDKTSPHTMNVSATLMKAGANQQLVASKLEEPAALNEDDEVEPGQQDGSQSAPAPAAPVAKNDGSLEIKHDPEEKKAQLKTLEELEKENAQNSDGNEPQSDLDRIHIDDEGRLERIAEREKKQAQEDAKAKEKDEATTKPTNSTMVLEPPTLGGALSANTKPEVVPPPVDPLSEPTPTAVGSMQHGKPLQPIAEQQKDQTLQDIEKAVASPHLKSDEKQASLEEAARNLVNNIENETEPIKPEPIAALNAQGDLDIDHDGNLKQSEAKPTEPAGFPPQLVPPDTGPPPDPTAGSANPSAPPPVPPPLMPPTS